MITRIISGGQTGADQGALDFALQNGIDAGGWCPKGRICENGLIPARYPVEEISEDDYNLRTKLNVRDSDGTLVIIRDGYMVEGTYLTIDYSKELGKPYFLADVGVMSGREESLLSALLLWIDEHQIAVLNIAGNRESNSPGIQAETAGLLEMVWAKLIEQSELDS